MAISVQLRAAIEDYGSQYQVAKDSGVAQQVIQQFMAGKRGLHIDTVDRLCEFFEMRLTRAKRRPPKGIG